MADLSPAAQAVLDAAIEAAFSPDAEAIAAAALRAAVDQVISAVAPPCEDFDEYAKGFMAAHVKYRRHLLAIVAELEGGNG